jgi:hypothetical protein
MADLALPDGSTLLHIGPHKTGTTAIQGALWVSRAALADHGVVYPGRTRHEMDAAMAVASGKVDPGKSLAAAQERWAEMRAELSAPGVRRGVLSSEFFSDAPTGRIPEVLAQVGPGAHVVVTLRPLVRILASQWQQYVQNQRTFSFEDWLHPILATPEPGEMTPTFWSRHRHDVLIRRWLDVVGPDRLTVLVVGEQDFLPRTFEQLLGVPAGTLMPGRTSANRSLTLDEVELVREFNKRYAAAGHSKADYGRLVRFGAVRELQHEAPHGGRIRTPAWAVDRVSEIAARMSERIASYGVRIIGSLEQLSDPAVAVAVGDNPPVEYVDADLAAALTAGLLVRMGRSPRDTDPAWEPSPVEAAIEARPGARPAPALPTRGEVLRELARRARRRLTPASM